MINININIANRITAILDDAKDAIPSELCSLVSLLQSQLIQSKCDEGLLIEIISLLQDYYIPSTSKNKDSDSSKKSERKEENEKVGALIIALHQIQEHETQSHSLKVRR